MILSAPEELYVEHIKLSLDAFGKIFPFYEHSLKRMFEISNDELINRLQEMVRYHDLGKLTKQWQNKINQKKSIGRIPHASIGASYLWRNWKNIYGELSDLEHAACFAVCIHHVDSGLVGESIERPDVLAVNAHVVDQFSSKIIWSEEAVYLGNEFFPKGALELDVYDLRDMANGLRIWSCGCSMLEQHRRRVLAAAVHHILKLCDFLAASHRTKDENNNLWQNSPYVRSMAKYLEKFGGC